MCHIIFVMINKVAERPLLVRLQRTVKAVAHRERDQVTHVWSISRPQSLPSPIAPETAGHTDWLPAFVTIRSHDLPDGVVVGQIIAKWHTSTCLVTNRDGKMHV